MSARKIFQLYGVDHAGKNILSRRLKREKLMELVANPESCTIAMEACGGANYWARKFTDLGHKVKLISPQFVKPYVKSNKNDRNDSEAICEATSRPNMRFVSPKDIEQKDIQSLHRIRSRLIQERTVLVNQIRGLLMEYGIVFPKQIQNVQKQLPTLLDNT
jgi:transposase